MLAVLFRRRASFTFLAVAVALVGFLAFILAAFLAASAASPGVAVAATKKVGVHVRGKEAGAVEKTLAQLLKQHRLAPVKGKQLQAAAKSLKVGLRKDDDLGAVARRLKLRAVVVGDVRDRGKRVEVKVYGADGGVLAEGDWSSAGGPRKLAAAVGRGAWGKIGGAIVEAREAGARDTAGRSRPAERAPIDESFEPAPKPKPAPAPAASAPVAARGEDPWATEPAAAKPPAGGGGKPTLAARDDAGGEGGVVEATPAGERRRPRMDEPEAVESESASAPASGEAPLALDVMAGLRLVSRDLSWVKDVNQSLRPLAMGGAPAAGFQVAWYPGAHFTRGWATQIGVAASGEYVPGIAARTLDGVEFPATDSDYWGGLRGRTPLGPVDAAVTLAYGQHAYFMRSSGAANRATLAVPDVRYTYLRIGADGRFPLPARFAVMGGIAYRYVLDAGKQGYEAQSSMYFPRATVTALDASAAVGYRFMPMLEARAGVDFRRYGLNMHPLTTDMRVVSGGVDHYLAFWLNLAVLLDGGIK